MATEMRFIKIPTDGIVRIPIMQGDATIGEKRIDLSFLPTVEAVEVVHGWWIRRHNETKCSKCQFIYYSNRDDFNYCPNCGAMMDLKKEEYHG